MDHLEMVEQVMLKTGCSFKDAKEALEHSEWSILDAVLYLEDNGQTDQASSRFSTGEQDASDTAFASEMQQERSEAEGSADKYYHEEHKPGEHVKAIWKSPGF